MSCFLLLSLLLPNPHLQVLSILISVLFFLFILFRNLCSCYHCFLCFPPLVLFSSVLPFLPSSSPIIVLLVLLTVVVVVVLFSLLLCHVHCSSSSFAALPYHCSFMLFCYCCCFPLKFFPLISFLFFLIFLILIILFLSFSLPSYLVSQGPAHPIPPNSETHLWVISKDCFGGVGSLVGLETCVFFSFSHKCSFPPSLLSALLFFLLLSCY